MRIDKYIAYKIIVLKVVPQQDWETYKKGLEVPLRKWNKNMMSAEDWEKAMRFEQCRIDIDETLPSRIGDNIFVFSNEKNHQRWYTRLTGELTEPYLLLTLSLTGEIKWFDSMYYLEGKPQEYWNSASDEPINVPLNEGIFTGKAIIEKVTLIKTKHG